MKTIRRVGHSKHEEMFFDLPMGVRVQMVLRLMVPAVDTVGAPSSGRFGKNPCPA